MARKPSKIKHEVQHNYIEYHKCLCTSQSGLTPEELTFGQWKDIMEHIVHCYNKRTQQESTLIKKLALGVLCKWYVIRIPAIITFCILRSVAQGIV
mgnify:CR=1 FL=1